MAKKRKYKRSPSSGEGRSQSTGGVSPYIIYGGVGLVVVGIIALLVASAIPSQNVVPSPTPIPMIDGLVEASEPLSRNHNEELEIPFEALPPMGGVHNPIWQNCGIYVNPVLPQHAVHTLEHGAVWLTYQPELDEASVEALQDKIRNESFMLMSPYPNQQSPIVLTAWGVQLEVDSTDDPRIDEFIEIYQQGPQTPEPGAACINGTSITVEG